MRALTRLLFALTIAAVIAAAGVAAPIALAVPGPPTVEIGDVDRVVGPDVDIPFSSIFENVTFECQLDSGDFVACTSPWELNGLERGLHTVRVRASFEEGAPGPADTVRFLVDSAGPTVFMTRPGPVTGPQVTISLFAFDISGIAKFECKLDGGEFEICASPVELELLEGQHTFSVRATDGAGNTGPVASVTWMVDATPPDTAIVLSPPNETNNRNARFVFSSAELPRTFECSLDDAPFARCDSPKVYADLNPGEHTFRVRAVDRAGNVDPTPAEATWHIGGQQQP